jgi:hypothetical protein
MTKKSAVMCDTMNEVSGHNEYYATIPSRQNESLSCECETCCVNATSSRNVDQQTLKLQEVAGSWHIITLSHAHSLQPLLRPLICITMRMRMLWPTPNVHLIEISGFHVSIPAAIQPLQIRCHNRWELSSNHKVVIPSQKPNDQSIF